MPNVIPSAIDWRESDLGALIAFEDSKSLDTPDDLFFQNLQLRSDKILIVGIGSGFILEHILRQNSQAKLIVIDCRESLLARQRKKYPQVEFYLLQNWSDITQFNQLNEWLKADYEKILNKPALGQQSSFLQEAFYFFNLRISAAVEIVAQLKNKLDDRWLINLPQFFQASSKVSQYPEAYTNVLKEICR